MAKTLIEVLEEQDIHPRDSSNGRKVVTCMFHKGDNEASFTIYPNDTYFCFGCQEWGDAVKFLVDYKGWENVQALKYVGEDFKQPKANKAQIIKVKNTTHTWKFVWEVAEAYHAFLAQTPGAINYLYSRGLTDETINKYRIGYTDGKVLNLKWAWEAEMGVETGLVTKNGYETLSHRITIPNIISATYADFIIGRTVTNDSVKYLGARMPKPIHGFYEVRHSPIIFLAEGQFDWLTLRQWGYPAAVFGGTHITQSQRMLLKDKKLVFIPDLDPSGIGMQAANGWKKSFGENAIILDYKELNPNPTSKLDISSLTTQEGAKERFMYLVKDQIPWITLLSNRMLNKYFPSFLNTILSDLILKQPA